MHKAPPHPSASLVTTDWLAVHLSDPDLLIFDCTVYLVAQQSDQPYRVLSGRADYDEGHIPGSGFLDLQKEFSVKDSPYRFTLPAPTDAAEAFGRRGIADSKRVILYSRKNSQWATRFWWMLRWLGFDNAAVLDGGYDKWAAEGRAVSTAPCDYLPGELSVNVREELFVGKEAVLAAIGDKGSCTINALAPDLHSGENSRYGRPGRIPGSVNVPAMTLFDPQTREIIPFDAVAQAFADVDADPAKRIIVYCGGGIAATLDAFLLHQLGYRNIAVYDNSMSEWATSTSLPMETDPHE